jgi:hypothetical protein
MSFQKPRHPGKPGMPRAFSEYQFLAIPNISRKAQKSRAAREARGAM